MKTPIDGTTCQLKRSDIPILKSELLPKQKYKCLICGRDFRKLEPRECCLDHSHVTWRVRGLLCRLCNSTEGKFWKVFTRFGGRNAGVDYRQFLRGLAKFYDRKETKYIYPPKSVKRKKRKKGKK